ncbi:MAG TPA: RluA family pseudouridine synthase [Verrucomicrobiae bacterium]
MSDLFEVISEDSDLLVINKPAGLVCHPTKTDEYSSLISRARLYLGPDSHPQLVNRLDRETSGVTLVAKTRDAARELRRLWERREVQKEYLAIVHGHVRDDRGVISAPLGKDERSRVAIKDRVRADGAEAFTEFQVQSRFERSLAAFANPASAIPTTADQPFSLLNVIPRTGRKHQIRIHLAHLGHPIVGDKLYGGDEDLYLALVEDRLTADQRRRLILPYHALHASQVTFTWRGRPLLFRAKPEARFSTFANGLPSAP